MRPGPRSLVIRPRRHPRIEPTPLPIDSRGLCVAALAAYGQIRAEASPWRGSGLGEDAEDIGLRYEWGRRAILARAAADPWLVAPQRREELRRLLESIAELSPDEASRSLVTFPRAFLATLERRRRRVEGLRRRRGDFLVEIVGPASSLRCPLPGPDELADVAPRANPDR